MSDSLNQSSPTVSHLVKLFFSVAAPSKMSLRSDCGCRLAASGPVLEIPPGMTLGSSERDFCHVSCTRTGLGDAG